MVYRLILVSSFVVHQVCSASPREAIRCEVPVHIQTGWICGARRVADDGSVYASFRGVPYAKQPVGRLRFQELLPAVPWDYYLDATEEGPVCPQHDELYGRHMRPEQGMSEACIYANIHVPIEGSKDDLNGHRAFEILTEADPDLHWANIKDQLYNQGIKNTYRANRNNQNRPTKFINDDGQYALKGAHKYEDYETRSSKTDVNYVRTRKVEQTSGLPILVYIHGGGFYSGSGDSDVNGPEYLVSRGVILITFNYRLNVFGFLSLNSPKIPGNQGLRDMVTLLRWVRRNARNFGGDPDNVTLMGQSAGAASAHLLSLSQATRGLFRRVIIMSGTGLPGFFTASPLYSKLFATQLLTRLGINSTDPDYIHNQLVSLPLEKILEANSAVQYIGGFLVFAPVVENAFPGVTRVLDDYPTELVKRGRGNQYPLIIGHTSSECELFRDKIAYLDLLNRIENNPLLILSPEIPFRTPSKVALELANRVLAKYFKGNVTMDEYLENCLDTFFRYPALHLANWRASMKGAPVYSYEFNFDSNFSVLKKALWLLYHGSAHVEDLTYVLKSNSILDERTSLPPRNEQMKNWMTKFVINFMRCSNPTCMMGPEWPPVHQQVYNYQLIETPWTYKDRVPSEELWDMIYFFDDINARAASGRRRLVNSTLDADEFVSNMTAQMNFERPPYALALIASRELMRDRNEDVIPDAPYDGH